MFRRNSGKGETKMEEEERLKMEFKEKADIEEDDGEDFIKKKSESDEESNEARIPANLEKAAFKTII